MSKRNLILSRVDDLLTDFLYYDRKADNDLEVGEIEKAIKSGKITIDEIVNKFKEGLEKA